MEVDELEVEEAARNGSDTTAGGVESAKRTPPVETSLLDELRAERQALTRQRSLDLKVPGYGRMVARYRAIGYKAVDDITERARKSAKQLGFRADLNAAADVLARSCVGIFMREDSGELIALNTLRDEWGDEPIRYDNRLAEAVGVEEGKARTVIFNVFGVDDPETGNDLVLMAHQTEVLTWAREANADDDEDF